MDDWYSLKLKMEAALEVGNLEEALLHLKAMIISKSPPVEAHDILTNHTIQGIPTFHYLARFCFPEEDARFLDRIFFIFKAMGYDVNKTTDKYMVSKKSSHGFTALMASVVHGNLTLMECLLKQGALPDIRDRQGFSPCHWAILKGNLKCLEKLVQFGGPSVVTTASFEKNGKREVRPLLHTAVDDGRLEIVRYLLSIAEEVGLEVNDQAVYTDIGLDKRLVYKSQGVTEGYDRLFTPLGRALYVANRPIIEALWNHPGAKPSRFKELESFVKFGEMEKALSLLKYIADEKLPADKIQDRWACINQGIFLDNYFAQFANEILECDGRGLEAGSVDMTDWASFLDSFGASRIKVTLLHLACLYKGLEIVKVLVEEAGADVNSKSEGEVEVTPLHILLRLKNWEGAKYLIEKGADLNIRGRFGTLSLDQFMRTRLIRRNLITGNLEQESTFNSVEIVLRMGCRENLLNQMLARPGIVWHGANEFHAALDGGNPSFILKVLQRRRSAKLISKEDLTWVTTCAWNTNGICLKVPSLIWLMRDLIERRSELNRLSLKKLSNLIKRLVNLGYDLNITWSEPPLLGVEKESLIFYILKFDLAYGTSNVLLKTFLQFDQLRLNVTIGRQLNPVEYLLEEWRRGCLYSETSMCANNNDAQQPPIVEAIKLLVMHGLSVTGMVIGPNFRYHKGWKIIFKLLCRAGVKISEEFFTSVRVCRYNSRGADAIAKEIQELKEWKEEFDRETRISLHRICSLRVRKMMGCVGDLKMLTGLPASLKADVMGAVYR